jgi:hypothetical protein
MFVGGVKSVSQGSSSAVSGSSHVCRRPDFSRRVMTALEICVCAMSDVPRYDFLRAGLAAVRALAGCEMAAADEFLCGCSASGHAAYPSFG